MDKDVLISVAGLQYEMDQNEPLEIISPGEYFFKNGNHYVFYEELTENDECGGGISKNRLKISPDYIELAKKGYNNTTMVFEKNKTTMSYYQTPFGSLLVGIHTTGIFFDEQEAGILVSIDYGLDINYSHVSDCNIIIKIVERN